MTRKHCAFCDRAGPLTKEHLWPKSLHKRLEDASSGNRNYFWLNRLKQVIASEPQVRDVCANCNNGVLSELDSYICDLFDAQLIHMPKQHETVTFSFDYHLLKRWLLKLSFNSARIHDSPDRQALQVLRPYIIGSDIFLGRSTQLFLQLVHPEKVPESDLETEYHGKEEIILEPNGNRTGHMFFRAHGIGEKLLRAVHLRSYSFFVAYWEPNAGRTEQNFFERVFGSQQRFATLLRPSKQSIQVVCDGMGAWESLRESRSTEIVFNGDV